jgi:thiosulfate/3-mercaptopyruvate sulfurtransferase
MLEVRMRRLLAVLVLSLAFGAIGAAKAQAQVPGPLVTVDWLASSRGKVVILDVRDGARTFTEEGHIPGAVLVDWREVRATGEDDGVKVENLIPSPVAFARLMQKSGVDPDSVLVVTSRGRFPEEIFLATRLHWQIKYFGHEQVAVLNGGTGAWAAAGREMSKAPSKVAKRGTWVPKAERREIVAKTAEVTKALEARSPLLADSRRIENYLGLVQYTEMVATPGHIPGAKYADATLFLQPYRPVTFRPVEEIRALLVGLGINANAPMITYCDTGDWASGTWFIFHELLGNKAARLYDGSMHSWTRDKARPTVIHRME